MKTVLAIDFDKWACATYAANFPDTEVRCASVADEIDRLPYADFLTGGFPCQPHSLAGKRLASADERDGGDDFVAAIRRVNPMVFLGENVAGILTSENGRYVQRLIANMETAGYMVEVKMLDAVNFGVPQFRKRVWFWGIRRDIYDAGARHKWPAPTHTTEDQGAMFGGQLLPAVTVGQALNLGNKSPAWIPCPEGCDEYYCTIHNQHVFECDCPPIDEWATDPYGKQSNGPAATPYHWSDAMLAKHPPAQPAQPAQPAPTVQAKWFKGGAEGLVEMADLPNHQPHHPAHTLSSGGEGNGMPFKCMAVSMQPCADGRTWEELHPPTNPENPANTVRARSPRDGGRCVENVIRDGLMVRRLTVQECARLQSMPDDFKWPSGISKTAQYRIIGNGQASLMVHHLWQAIDRAVPGMQTHISLFCGGGVGDCGLHGKYWEYKP